MVPDNAVDFDNDIPLHCRHPFPVDLRWQNVSGHGTRGWCRHTLLQRFPNTILDDRGNAEEQKVAAVAGTSVKINSYTVSNSISLSPFRIYYNDITMDFIQRDTDIISNYILIHSILIPTNRHRGFCRI